MFIELIKTIHAFNITTSEFNKMVMTITGCSLILIILITNMVVKILGSLFNNINNIIELKKEYAYKMNISKSFISMSEQLAESGEGGIVDIAKELTNTVINGGENNGTEPLPKQTGEDTHRVSNPEESTDEA